MTPIEVLDLAISRGLVTSVRPGPGGIVQRCSEEERKTLSRLTSKMLAEMRVPEYVCRVGERQGRAHLHKEEERAWTSRSYSKK